MRYTPITINFCRHYFTSIEVDGIYQYPISQLPFDPKGNRGFPIHPDTVQRDLEAILGKGFPFVRLATSLHPEGVDCIGYDSLSQVVRHYARVNDSDFAWILLGASFNTELERSNDLIRRKRQQEGYYQDYLENQTFCLEEELALTYLREFCDAVGLVFEYFAAGVPMREEVSVLQDLYERWKLAHPRTEDRIKNPFRKSLTSAQRRLLKYLDE